MCILCDVNVFPDIFSKDINEFTPIKNCVINGCGKFVYGGKSYLSELERMRRYTRILKILSDLNKTVVVDEKSVNDKEEEIKAKVNNQCNDCHLIAILAVSGCKILCSKDKNAYAYIKQSDLYSPPIKKPKIYSKKSNHSLLCDENIANCCLPKVRLSSANARQLDDKLHNDRTPLH